MNFERKEKPEGGGEEEDLSKLFKGQNRVKVSNKEKMPKEEGEMPEKKKKGNKETIRKPEIEDRDEAPIEESIKEPVVEKELSKKEEAKEDIFTISNKKASIQRKLDIEFDKKKEYQNREEIEKLQNELRPIKQEYEEVRAKYFVPGDEVMWVSQGEFQWKDPEKIIKIDEYKGQKFAFFSGSQTGISFDELKLIKEFDNSKAEAPTAVGVPTEVGKKSEKEQEEIGLSDLDKQIIDLKIKVKDLDEKYYFETEKEQKARNYSQLEQAKKELDKLQEEREKIADEERRGRKEPKKEEEKTKEEEEKIEEEKPAASPKDKQAGSPKSESFGGKEPKDKTKEIKDEIEELERRLRIYGPVGWFRKPKVQSLRYLGDRARLKELKKELKKERKGRKYKRKAKKLVKEIFAIEKAKKIEKKIPVIKRKSTLISKRLAKRDFGVAEQTKLEDEQKKLEKQKKKLEKRLRKLKRKFK